MKTEAATIACDIQAIHSAERPRHAALLGQMRAAVRERREVEQGYAFRLDGSVMSLQQTAEWFNLERLCCPFLTLQLEVEPGAIDWWVTLTGPAGVKPLLTAELMTD